MTQQSIQKIIQALGSTCIAVYSYEQSKHVSIPLFVLEGIHFGQLAEIQTLFGTHKFIMLTQTDVQQGADVFALRFLHMQQHSTLLHGVDVLGKIALHKKDVRSDLEREARQKAIQLREEYLSYTGSIGELVHALYEGVAKIAMGVAFLSADETTKNTEGEKLLADMSTDKKISSDQLLVLIDRVHAYMVHVSTAVNDYSA